MRLILSKLLPKKTFAKNAAVLMTGTVLGQMLMALASPLLTRLYSPDDFGVLAVYVGLLTLFSVLANLRLELAIPLPKRDAMAASVAMASLIAVCGITFLAVLMVTLAGDFVVQELNAPRLGPYLWLLPLTVFLTGGFQALKYWAIRTQKFNSIARTSIFQVIITLSIQVGGAAFGIIALLLGQTAAQLTGIAGLIPSIWRKKEFSRPRWRYISMVPIRYWKFPVFSTMAGFCNTAGTQLPSLLFAAFFGVSSAGFYLLANRVLLMPAALVGEAVTSVFFSNAAIAYREGRLGSLIQRAHDHLARIGMPFTVLLFFISPDLFALVFGEAWREAGELARWMVPGLYWQFVTAPLTTVFSVTEKQPQAVVFQLSLLALRAAAIMIGAWQNNFLLAVILFSSFSIIAYVGALILMASITNIKYKELFMPTVTSLFSSVLLITPLIIYHAFLSGPIAYLGAALISIILVAARYLIIVRQYY